MDVDLPESLRGDGRLVSVIIPTYQDADRLPSALESVANQTHDNIEIIVVDSSGVNWLSGISKETRGMKYVFQEPSGLAAARNRGIDVASGEVIGFLDADDRWVPEKLVRQLREIDAGADVVYSDTYVLEPEGRRYLSSLPITETSKHHIDFLFEGGVPVLTVLARRECLEQERFEERLPAVEDRHLIARLFREFTPGRVAEPLGYYSRRTDSMSSDPDLMYEAELQSLSLLSERYDDIARHQDALVLNAQYKYGKRLIRVGRARDARRQLFDAFRNGHVDVRSLALLAVSLFPAGNRRALGWLERIQERLRAVRF